MLLSVEQVHGADIRARDGTIGTAEDFYFDDTQWYARYLVVNTGGWLSGRKVLITPYAVGAYDAARHELQVSLTRDQVSNSPDIDTDKPVSRQYEARLHDYYGWSPYWGEGLISGNLPPTPEGAGPAYTGDPVTSRVGRAEVAAARSRIEKDMGDPHLRSARTVIGHHIRATDGDIGHVEDFLLEDRNWAIRYMVVDTRNWLPGKKVLVSPQWIENVSWPERSVMVDLTREQIKNSPEYDPSRQIERGYEDRLFHHYGRAPYW